MSRVLYRCFLLFLLLVCGSSINFSCHDNQDNAGKDPVSCSNGIRDIGEQCIDCGGPCKPCPYSAGRYIKPVFSDYIKYSDIVFGTGTTQPSGYKKNLTCEFYEAKDDTLHYRPLILLMGQTTYTDDPDESFFTGSINYVINFLSKGYTVANISGIRYWEGEYPMSTEAFLSTTVRIRADYLGAIRYFRENADEFRIDTGNIWLMGSSMGAMAAMHAAYLGKNDMEDLDPYMKFYINSDGGIAGSIGNLSVSSAIKGVISLSGMILNINYIDEGEPYLMSIIGKNDLYRPMDCEKIKVNWIRDSLEFCGPESIKNRMVSEGFKAGDRVLKLIDISPADQYAPYDPKQCPECPDEITNFIAAHLGYCL